MSAPKLAIVPLYESEPEAPVQVPVRAKHLQLSVSHVSIVASHSEIASQVSNSVRPTRAFRDQEVVAADFDLICRERLIDGDESATNRAIARRLGIDERRVREWRSGARPIPSDVWLRIGDAIASQFLGQLLARVKGGR